MRPRSPLQVCAALAFLAACGVGRPPANDGSDAAASAGDGCTQCHGSGSDPAPPRSAHGETATTSLGVGAHQAHLRDGALHRGVACTECHVVPTSVAHADGDARVTFGPTANASGAASSWDRASATCTTYCHGATLGGGSHTAPVWTAGVGEAACGSCHGTPPPAPHPATTADCGACHAGYTRTTVNLATHVDGTVQVGGAGGGAQSCTSCHGDPARAANQPAPPRDTAGNTATTAPGVGAHQVHLGATLSAPVACGECHVVPTSLAHANGAVDLAFGPLARTGGAAAAFDPTALTCAVYCHGATLGAGGTATAPLWTRVDGTQKTCTSCHGAPPPTPHAQSSDCGACHAGYTSSSVNASTHVNGRVDVAAGACTSCHGTPPSSGQHQRGAHVSRSCGDCHSGYTASSANPSLHLNGAKDVGGAGTRINSWNASTRTCAPACHGSETW